MEHITKSFSGVRVLKDVSFSLKGRRGAGVAGRKRRRKIHAYEIMSGVYTRDSGTYRLFGKEQGNLTPKAAQGWALRFIHQELEHVRASD